MRDVTESEMQRLARADADRLRRMHAVTEALSYTLTRREVAGVLARQGREALSADAVLVMFVDEAKRHLAVAASEGYPADVADKWSLLPLEVDAPLTEVARTGTPLFFPTHVAVIDRYPALADARHGDDEALAAVPLTFHDETFGVVGLVFRRPREFTEADRSFILHLARHSALAIERARLLESERAARSEAEAANHLKDEFLATMSHELRTPLNAVLGWATLLRTRMTEPEAQRGLEAIERNARIQARLVEDVLDVSRIMSGKLHLDVSTVEVASIVSSAVEIIRPAAYSKSVDIFLMVEDVCMISGDAARLQQVVWNLVSNAVKFTPAGGRVDVGVHRRGAHAVIEVRDSGAGIPADFLPHVFDRFRQLDGSTSRRQGGLGLGLSIVRSLVEMHGGTVRAESDGVGRGATFTVALPEVISERPAPLPDRPSAARSPTAAVAGRVLDGVRVLVVDDDEDGREIFHDALAECGARVSSVSSAAVALARLQTERPDVVVCDIGMPDTDGYALFREVRSLPESAGGRTPAIAVTGFARGTDMQRAFDAGFQKHLAKPADLGTLIQLILELTGRAPS